MVFAVNSVESSARNFTAFQGLAMSLNGTGSSTASPSATPSPKSGASALSVPSAGFALALGALLVSFL